MSNPTERAVRTYAAAWTEPDAAARARMLEACFAVDGRIVTRGGGIHGRAALIEAMAAFVADPRGLTARIVGVLDAAGPTFRFRTVVEHRDGTIVEGFDVGEVDADGRITVLITFAGTLPEPGPAA